MNKSYKNSGYNSGRNDYYESKPKKYTNKLDDLFEKSLSATTDKKQEELIENKQNSSKQNNNEKKYENEKDYYQQYDNNNEVSYQEEPANYNSSYDTGRNRNKNYNYNNNTTYGYQNKFNQNQNQKYQKENYSYENYQNDTYNKDNSDVYYNIADNNYKENAYYENDNSYNKNKNYNASSLKNKKANRKNNGKNKVLSQEEKIKSQKDQIEKLVNKLKYKAPELTYNLINELIEAEYECMICNDVVNQSEETWGCDKCYTIYHIKCIYDWIFKLNSSKESENKQSKKIASIFKWSCPHCNCNYSATTDNLPKYNCYCKRYYKAEEGSKKGIEEYKSFNPQLIPHGCGLLCDTKICRHVTCELPCHPGPHLQCNEIEQLICYCGNSSKEVACASLGPNSDRKFTCDTICGKTLNCKRHKCKAYCHEGDCESLFRLKKCEECTVEAKLKFMNFLNGLEQKIKIDYKKEVKFAEEIADYIFHGMLLCKIHFVETNTDDNLRLLLKLVQISGNSLLENIKKFIPICRETVTNSCVCKSKSTKTECYKLNYKEDIMDFLGFSEQIELPLAQCAKVCKALKSCKNHTCDRVCCELANVKITNYSLEDPKGLHLCLIICNKDLNCGKHKCENYCHRGNCLPCKTIIREGESVCSCGNTRIKAPFTCGSKPVCELPCTRERACPHPCPLNCHDGACPKCEEKVIKMCNCGKAAIENVTCGDAELPKCYTVCDEMLPCGAHFCDIVCHNHTEEYDKNYFCNLACGRQFKYCKHNCKKRCHGDSDCWEIECDAKVKISCKCKVNKKDFKCGEVKKLSNNFSEEYFINCNDECKRVERLKKIEIAFDGLFKYNQEKNRQMLKGIGEAKNKEIQNANLNKNKTDSDKVITRNWGDKDQNQKEESLDLIKTEEKSEINNFNKDEIVNSKKDEIEKQQYEEIYSRICDVKFSYRNISFACSHVKFVIELENSAEKALKNLTSAHEINSLDKKEFIFASEFLRTYYNIETEKIKKGNDLYYHIVLKNCHEGKIPRIKLSLLALLLKSHKFVNIPIPKNNMEIPKEKIIYHPFEMSIYIQDYRLHVTAEAIDAYLSNIIPTDNYYVNEIDKGKCYVHFFDEYNCKKVFKELKIKPSQFQDCYEVEYFHNENWKFEDFYLYLKNADYFKYLNDLTEDPEHELIFDTIRKSTKNQGKDKNAETDTEENKNKESIDAKNDKEKKVELKDNDGFTMVTKKKKK